MIRKPIAVFAVLIALYTLGAVIADNVPADYRHAVSWACGWMCSAIFSVTQYRLRAR